MKLKHNLMAGACLAVLSASSFAATPLSCVVPTDAATALTFVKNCAVEQTLFIGGASTFKSPVGTMLLGNGTTVSSAVFDTAAMTPIKIVDKGSVSGLAGNVIAYFGKSKATLTTTSKNLLVVYNFNNGSAAGVSQLLAKPSATDVPESDVVTVGSVKNVANATCTASATAGLGTIASPYSVDCTSHAAQQADMAVSDVNAGELYKLYAKATGKLSTLKATPLVSQSFGVVASPLMYAALQAQNIAEGKLAGTCAGDTTAACQPSIRSADYASLVSKTGAIKSLAALVPAAGVTGTLVLARRDDLSGTQASSNMFFVNGQCGYDNAKGTIAKAGGLLGGLPIISSADAATYPNLSILAASVSNDVKVAVSSTTDYAIGVLNVGSGGTVAASPAVGSGVGRFVKVDGVSPNFVNGTQDSLTPLRTGDYPFAMTTVALQVSATMTKFPEKKALTDAMIVALKDSTLAQSGLAYFDGAVSAKQALVKRAGDNNCSPLVKF